MSHSDQFDSNLVNNTASVKETPQQADLVVADSINSSTPNVGDTVTYTVTVMNAGPNLATNVSLAGCLAVRYRRSSPAAAPGRTRTSSGVWNVRYGDERPRRRTLTIVATVVTSAPTTLTASVSHSDQFDPNQVNNTASVKETPQQADLVVADHSTRPHRTWATR